MSISICVCLLFPIAPDAKTTKQVESDAKAFEQAILLYVASLGTEKEKSALSTLATRRNTVVSHRQLALPSLTRMLKNRQVNVRRGAAIALFMTVEQHGIDDEKLLDAALRRMIEDPDIKCRSNLYHLVNTLISNIKKRPQKR